MISHPTTLLALSAGLAAAAPFTFPLPNGFPNLTPTDPAVTQIQLTAGGTLSNNGAPTGLNPETVNSFGLIAFNELFEVAFFSSLLANVSAAAPGYALPPIISEYTIDALTAVVAQEELHALTANAIRKANGAPPIQPCEYVFSTSDFESAVALAQTFTDVVLGTLQDVQFNAVKANGPAGAGVIQAVSAVIGQEGQQDGYYRSVQAKRPSAQPFLTGGARAFAFSALQAFVVPGSCPSLKDIDFPIFEPLTLVTEGIEGSQKIQFSATNVEGKTVDASCQKLAYLNGANKPNVVDFTVVGGEGGEVLVEAYFPHDEFVMDGLTVAAIVGSGGDFSSNDGVAAAAVFGPGLVEVN